jgi:hypothetical protein
METKDIIGKEFEFFEYKDVPHLKWDEDYAKWLGSKCVVIHPHSRYPEATMVDVYPTIGKKFTKHFPTEQIKEQLEKAEYDNKSTEELLNDMKQLISRI